MSHGKAWSEYEVKLLYSDLSNEEIANKIGRSVDAVYSQRHNRGIPSIHSDVPAVYVNDKFVPIDGAKLQSELTNRNLTHEDVARMIGVGHSTVGNMVCKNRVSKLCMVSLESVIGIKYDDIKPTTEVVTVKDESQTVHSAALSDEQFDILISTIKEANKVNWDAMYKTIYAASYEAVKRALNEPVAEGDK